MKNYPITLIEMTTVIVPELKGTCAKTVDYKGWLCTSAIDGTISILKDVTYDEYWNYNPETGRYVQEEIPENK